MLFLYLIFCCLYCIFGSVQWGVSMLFKNEWNITHELTSSKNVYLLAKIVELALEWFCMTFDSLSPEILWGWVKFLKQPVIKFQKYPDMMDFGLRFCSYFSYLCLNQQSMCILSVKNRLLVWQYTNSTLSSQN